MTPGPGRLAPVGVAARTDATGTVWRLRSLAAMGHDSARIARALGVPPALVRRVVRGQARTITCGFQAAACQLWDAWWDKRPPERTWTQRRAASAARRQAERHGWPAAAALDEDELDQPGYRPFSRYRPATGTGIAGDFQPAATPQTSREIA